MANRRKLKVVGLIVAGGVLAALPFARRADWIAPEQIQPKIESRAVPLQLAVEGTPSPAVGLNDQEPASVEPPRIAALPPQPSRLQDDGSPPELPERYHPLLETAPPRTPVAVERPRAPTLELDEPQVRIEPTRPHRIVDGDTLARIAQRYYGDASLGERLFAANRDMLSAPDTLPIGATLRIPPASALPNLSRPAPPDEPAPIRAP